MMYEPEFLQRLQQALRLALPAWGMPSDAALKLLSISENATYLVEETTTGARLVMRMQRPEYHTDAEIQSELAWVGALRESGLVHTAEPLRTKNGQWIHKVEDGEITHRITAFSFIQGQEPALEGELHHWYRMLGTTNARLHQHSRQWKAPAGFVRKHWNFDTLIGPQAHWGDWREAQSLTAADISLLEQVQARLKTLCQAYGQSSNRYGLVHCDMRLANLLVEGEKLAVVDFDDCGFSWYLYDFAACISFIELDPRVPQLLEAWLEGYRSVSPVDDEDVAMVSPFIMLRRMQLTAWIASHAETPTAQRMGEAYVRGTVEMGQDFLERFKEFAA